MIIYLTHNWNSEWVWFFPGREKTLYICLGKTTLHIKIGLECLKRIFKLK